MSRKASLAAKKHSASASFQHSRLTSESDLNLIQNNNNNTTTVTPKVVRRKSNVSRRRRTTFIDRKRVSRVLTEIHEYEFREKEELITSIKAQAKELAFFFTLFVIYVLFGGFTFFYIEECSGASLADDGSTPSLVDVKINATFHDTLKTCRDIYDEVLKIITTNLTNINTTFLTFYPSCQNILYQAVEPYLKTEAYSTHCEVNEDQLLKYAEYTIFTLLTVGYGNTTPVTIIGRYVLILYAIFGVPIAVSMYSVAGKLLIQIFTFAVQFVEKRLLKRKGDVKKLQAKVLIMSCIVMLLIMLLGCSMTMRHDMEDWTFSSSIYFWFVSLTTIGYGDLHFNRNKHLESIHFLMLSAGNLLFGLGISAAIIEAFAMALEQREQLIEEDDDEDDEGDDDDNDEDKSKENDLDTQNETVCDGTLSERSTGPLTTVRFEINQGFADGDENNTSSTSDVNHNNWYCEPKKKNINGDGDKNGKIIVMEEYHNEDEEYGSSVSSGESGRFYHGTVNNLQ